LLIQGLEDNDDEEEDPNNISGKRPNDDEEFLMKPKAKYPSTFKISNFFIQLSFARE
jgi:hypothetical protein